MEKVGMLVDLLENRGKGLDEDELLGLAWCIVDVLDAIHGLGYYYIDFSLNNIGIKNGEWCMLDFGGLHNMKVKLSPIVYTLFYCSRSLENKGIPTRNDDLEGAGFVLFYAKMWPVKKQSKQSIIVNSKKGDYGKLLECFFSMVEL